MRSVLFASLLFLVFVSSLDLHHEGVIELGQPPKAPSRLFQWGPGDDGVGTARQILFSDGVVRKLITRSLEPLILEIEDFVGESEGRVLASFVRSLGRPARLHVEGSIAQSDSRRVGNTTFLDSAEVRKALPDLLPRTAELLRLPREILEETEDMQVIEYGVGGHYVPHFDSEGLRRSDSSGNIWKKPLRFATVLYGLEEADVGGETSFPNINQRISFSSEASNGKLALNLLSKCEGFSIRLRKGNALLWYNHMLEDVTPEFHGQSGEIGELDISSCHMACDVKQGVKIVANHWIDIRPSNLALVQPVFGPVENTTDYLVYRKAHSRMWGSDGPQTRILNGLQVGDFIVWLFVSNATRHDVILQGFRVAAKRALASSLRKARFAWVMDDEHGCATAADFHLQSSDFPALAALEIGSKGSQDRRQVWRITDESTPDAFANQILKYLSQLPASLFLSSFESWNHSKRATTVDHTDIVDAKPSEL